MAVTLQRLAPLGLGVLSVGLAPAAALALEPLAIPQITASSLPAPPPPMGLPQLQTQVSCPALQQRLKAVVGGEASV